MTGSPMVIVGGGLAGAKTAEQLREQGYDGELVLIGDEADPPYDRPPLSKDYLNGKTERDKVFVHSQDWYSEHGVDLRLGQPAVELDRAARTVRLAGGTSVSYDCLLIATGSSPRTLSLPGADHSGLLYLRRLADSDRIRETLATATKLVVIGAGWIGLEVAAAARTADVDVSIIEAAELPLLQVLGPEVARSFADLHVSHDVDLRLGAELTEIITDEDRPRGVRLGDGSTIEGDAVLVGVGAAPNIRLAQDAGLAVSDGIDVDASLRTSDDRIFAAGDVAAAEHPLFGRRIRVEHWANALNQPAVAAASMLGKAARYDRLPYFYTDQYDLGMEYVGYVEPGGYDRVTVRGDLETREYIAFWTKGNRVQAAMSVNIWDVVEDLKSIIIARHEIDAELLADSSVPLSALA
jgi:3-phenylpropionate/trans-cinnamate dioxygenase ferredoxin reductase subunit